MKLFRIFGLGTVLTILITATTALAAFPKVNSIMIAIDDITRLKTDGTAKVEMTEQKAGEGTKNYAMVYYRRDRDDAFLIVFTAPESDKGNGYLRVSDNFWMYRRNTRTFQHVNRDESIGGTNAKSEDFERKDMIELYKPVVDKTGAEKISETKLGAIPVYQFEIVAKVEDVSYPKRVYWVRKDNYLPLKVQSYSANGTLMETDYFLTYTQIQGKFLWIKGMFIDEFEKGNKTIVEIKNISIQKIDDHVFTKAYLENLSK